MRLTQIQHSLVTATLSFAVCGAAVAATPAVMIIGGSPAGVTKGDIGRNGVPGDQIQLINVTRSGVDSATGMVSGRGNQRLITVTKVYAPNSAQLEQAAAENRVLPEVTITFAGGGGAKGSNATGMASGKRTAQRLLLKNAQITQIVQTRNVQQISITYQTIEVTYSGGGISATDDWETP